MKTHSAPSPRITAVARKKYLRVNESMVSNVSLNWFELGFMWYIRQVLARESTCMQLWRRMNWKALIRYSSFQRLWDTVNLFALSWSCIMWQIYYVAPYKFSVVSSKRHSQKTQNTYFLFCIDIHPREYWAPVLCTTHARDIYWNLLESVMAE